jgi:hypothetical protein
VSTGFGFVGFRREGLPITGAFIRTIIQAKLTLFYALPNLRIVIASIPITLAYIQCFISRGVGWVERWKALPKVCAREVSKKSVKIDFLFAKPNIRSPLIKEGKIKSGEVSPF